jgi:hypothetical protein
MIDQLGKLVYFVRRIGCIMLVNQGHAVHTNFYVVDNWLIGQIRFGSHAQVIRQ